MSLKESQASINFETVKHFRMLFNKNKRSLLRDKLALSEIDELKKSLEKFDDMLVEIRSVAASKKLSAMTEEERQMLLMTPEEKKFFLKYKKLHPDDPWGYYKEYQQNAQKKYEMTGKI